MHALKLIIDIVAAVAGGLALLLSIPLFFAFRWPAAVMWFTKLYVSALSPVFAVVGALTLVAGLTTGATFITFLGAAVTLVYSLHWIAVTRPPAVATSFERAFGPNWERNMDDGGKNQFFIKRGSLFLPKTPKPRFTQNLPYATVAGTNRELLCDIWQPPKNIAPSGLAFVYVHGSAFYFLDKDFGTRPFFSHLAAEGHVIMDIAYRLAPDTDMIGMTHDVMHAVAWMKEHAKEFGIHPSKIILGGGSAGAHLALLAAYTSDNTAFVPADLLGRDLSVCGVISLYGTSDLEALYYHTGQDITIREVPGLPKKKVPTKMPNWIVKKMGDNYHRLGMDKDFKKIGSLPAILGGHPDECPEAYALYSPVSHVHAHCPPTLFVHGAHDIMAPVASTRRLYYLLLDKHVPAILHILPQTDHGFDLTLPRISPSAHNAIHDVERFMAVMAGRKVPSWQSTVGSVDAI